MHEHISRSQTCIPILWSWCVHFFLNLLASVAFYLHVTIKGYLDFVSPSLSKYNTSQSAIEFHLAHIVIGLNFLMLFLFCLSCKIWSVVAASALHSWLCIQSTLVSKLSPSHTIIYYWGTFAAAASPKLAMSHLPGQMAPSPDASTVSYRLPSWPLYIYSWSRWR